MTEKSKYTESVVATLKADSLRNLYDVLDSEETPFETKVQKADKGERLVTIYTEPKHLQHFTGVLNKCKSL